jgi:hypothetical protein
VVVHADLNTGAARGAEAKCEPALLIYNAGIGHYNVGTGFRELLTELDQ